MLIITVDGQIIGTGEPTYIHQTAFGWDFCSAEEAEGIVVDSARYSIHPDRPITRDPLYDADGTLIDPAPIAPLACIRDDGGRTVAQLDSSRREQAEQIGDLETGTVEIADTVDVQAGQIADLETGAMDLADAVDAATSGTDDALMDLGDFIAELTARVEALEAEKKGA